MISPTRCWFRVRVDLESRVKSSEDSVMVVDISRTDDTRVLFIGVHEDLPGDGAIIA